MTHFRLLRLLALLPAAAAPGFADAPDAPPVTPAPEVAPVAPAPEAKPAEAVAPKPELKLVRARLLLGQGEKSDSWYRREASGDYAEVRVTSDYPGEVWEFSRGEPPALYRRETTPEGAPRYVELVRLGADGPDRRLIVLDRTDAGWRARAYDDGVRVFPGGTALVINDTAHRLRFDFGGTTLEVPPGTHGILPRPKVVRKDSATIRISRMSASGSNVFFDYAWPWYPNRRTVLFARPGATPEKVVVNGVDDVRRSAR